MNKNTKIAIMLSLFCTLFTSSAQFFLKSGADRLKLDFFSIITNYYLFLGIICYLLGAGVMLMAFKYGEITLVYPIFSTSFIWVTTFSFYLFNETIHLFKIIGILCIVFGVICIAYGGQKKSAVDLIEVA